MKVYSLPDTLPAPVPDYHNYDRVKEEAREEQHKVDLKAWLVKNGFKGPLTGEIVSFPVADGCALYMMADGPRSGLVHLPYGDGYRYPDAQYLPKAEIVRRMESGRKLAALSAAKSPVATTGM